MKNNRVLKPLSIALMLTLLFSLVGCREMFSFVTADGNAGILSDPSVAPTIVPLMPSTEAVETDTHQDNINVMEINVVNIVSGNCAVP